MKTPPLNLIGSFLAFSQASNMQEAAQSLGISQPALTSHLQQFQQHFQQDVFGQQGRKKILTEYGQQLKDLFSRRFANLDNEIHALNTHYLKPQDATIKIAGRSEILNYMASRIAFPGHLIFVEQDGNQAVQGVLNSDYEIAISNHTSKASALFAKKLFFDQFALVLPKKWAQDKKHLSLSLIQQLLDHNYLAYKEQDEVFRKLLDHYEVDQKVPGQKLQPHRVIANWPNLLTMVELGQGWTLAPTRYAVGSSCISIPVPVSLIPETQFYILYRQESSSLIWFKELVEDIRQACN